MAKPNKLGLGSGGGAKRLLSGAGGSLGAGHGVAGGAPLSQLAPASAKKAAKDADKNAANPTKQHNFGAGAAPHGSSAAKGGGGAGAMRRTAPGG